MVGALEPAGAELGAAMLGAEQLVDGARPRRPAYGPD
jgi:hypothetical protein